MFWVSTAMATVQGTYTSFLVTIMAFSILQDEFAFGAYSAMVALVGLVSSVALAARSQARRPHRDSYRRRVRGITASASGRNRQPTRAPRKRARSGGPVKDAGTVVGNDKVLRWRGDTSTRSAEE